MEFTGAKDKDDYDIYEGDLLSIPSLSSDIYEVKWNDQYLCNMFYRHEFLRLPEKNNDIPITHHSLHELIIKGNIYQHPELINQ